MLVAQECFNEDIAIRGGIPGGVPGGVPGGIPGGIPGGGVSADIIRCTIETLGFVPSGPDALSPEQMMKVARACMGGAG